jgi:GxxExxY protein
MSSGRRTSVPFSDTVTERTEGTDFTRRDGDERSSECGRPATRARRRRKPGNTNHVIYIPCLHYELTARNLRFVAQRSIPIVYKGMSIEACYRVDLIVEDVVVVEVKSVAAILPVHEQQLQTYLKLTGCPVGELINFNVPRLMDGVKRRLNPKADLSNEAME